jgi:glyoxylase-like metal-dependent hydrolase (beta-lactamase superfamily II)
MLRSFSLGFLLVLATSSPSYGAPGPAGVPADVSPEVGFSIIKTSQVAVVEALLVPGGSIFKKINSNFSAFLIKHKQDYLLFDTGMGRQVDSQYRQDMPLWARPFFKYDHPVTTAREQLDRAGFAPVKRVILSHSHWDHAGGVPDFPESLISVSAQELAVIGQPKSGPGGTWASQVGAASIRWEVMEFKSGPFKGYARSLDVYRNGKVVLVPMPGHTPGSVGLFVTVDSGVVYFFIGDVAWTRQAVNAGAPKFWAAGLLVDGDARGTQASVEQVRNLVHAEPGLVVVPAHDSNVQDALGYFPRWVK